MAFKGRSGRLPLPLGHAGGSAVALRVNLGTAPSLGLSVRSPGAGSISRCNSPARRAARAWMRRTAHAPTGRERTDLCSGSGRTAQGGSQGLQALEAVPLQWPGSARSGHWRGAFLYSAIRWQRTVMVSMMDNHAQPRKVLEAGGSNDRMGRHEAKKMHSADNASPCEFVAHPGTQPIL
jgi:hypothetical protein